MPKKTSRGRYNWARPAALLVRGGRPLVDAGFPRDGDEVMIVGRRREEKVDVGAAVSAVLTVPEAVRSKFKRYQRIASPKRYTQAHKVAGQQAVLMVALN